MKNRFTPSIMAVLLLCAGCTQTQMPSFTPLSTHASDAAPKQNLNAASDTSVGYASDASGCDGVAKKRLTMFEKPDTFPVSAQEDHDAYLALYSECMREHNWQVAGPVRPATVASDASQFATLSPAAGGNTPPRGVTVNSGNATVSSSSVPGATVVVIGGNNKDAAPVLSSLSPSAGGSSGQNSTVVLVQSPQNQPSTIPYYAYAQPAPTAPLPVAVPVAPLAKTAPAVTQPQTAPSLAPTAASAPQPSLASADAAATSIPSSHASNAATEQLENVLEK